MIELPCGALFEVYKTKIDVYQDTNKYHEIRILDNCCFSEICHDVTYDDENYQEGLFITFEDSSIWPIIRELERYAKENGIKEKIDETK